MLYLNPNGFRLCHIIKIEDAKKDCIEREIDGMLMAKINCRWNTMYKEKVRKRLKGIKRNLMLVTLDSVYEINKPPSWLPGGTMLSMWGQIVNFVTPNSQRIDELGRWSSVQISRNKKYNS